MSSKLWNEISQMFEDSTRKTRFNNEQSENGINAIALLQITEKSALGAIVLNTSGVVVDDWIRVFGHGCESHKGIIEINKINQCGIATSIEKMLIIADDVVGGIFALNAGKFNIGIGDVWYFAPDTLEWESMDMKYSEFLAWISQGNVDEFYSTMRWDGWRVMCKDIDFNNAILMYPFLWSSEFSLESSTKKIVPVNELFQINQEYSRKFMAEKS